MKRTAREYKAPWRFYFKHLYFLSDFSISYEKICDVIKGLDSWTEIIYTCLGIAFYWGKHTQKIKLEDAISCSVIALFILGLRVGLLIYWLLPIGWEHFNLAFNTLIRPILGTIFLPWTAVAVTLYFGQNGLAGFDWVWVAGGLAVDILSYTSGALIRKETPGFPNSAPSELVPRTNLSALLGDL